MDMFDPQWQQEKLARAEAGIATVAFTQYCRPDGHPRAIEVDIPDPYGEVAQALVVIGRHGVSLEAEVLPNGLVSFTVTDEEDGDLFIEICQNGPPVIAAISKLLKTALHEHNAGRWPKDK
ncbi:MAG: hypothetical protein WC977_10705 [Anaerovoracaceae bacterium]|jgi:hypothetical protein